MHNTLNNLQPTNKLQNLDNLGKIITELVPYIFGIAGILLLVYLVLGGFGIMNSKGDPKAIEGAKQKITYALVGFIIIFVSFWLVQILGITTGVDQIEKTFTN